MRREERIRRARGDGRAGGIGGSSKSASVDSIDTTSIFHRGSESGRDDCVTRGRREHSGGPLPGDNRIAPVLRRTSRAALSPRRRRT